MKDEAGMEGAARWLPRKAGLRFVRVSVRALLIGVTLVALLCAWWSNGARRQQRAVGEIEAVYGRVFYDFNAAGGGFTWEGKSPWPKWLVDWCGVDFFHAVAAVDLDAPSVTDATMQSVASLGPLRHLYLSNTSVTSAGLVHLRELPRLEMLVLSCDTIDDEGIAHLKDVDSLEVLWIHHAPISDAGIMHLKGLRRLRKLWLSDTNVTDKGARAVAAALPSCRVDW